MVLSKKLVAISKKHGGRPPQPPSEAVAENANESTTSTCTCTVHETTEQTNRRKRSFDSSGIREGENALKDLRNSWQQPSYAASTTRYPLRTHTAALSPILLRSGSVRSFKRPPSRLSAEKNSERFFSNLVDDFLPITTPVIPNTYLRCARVLRVFCARMFFFFAVSSLYLLQIVCGGSGPSLGYGMDSGRSYHGVFHAGVDVGLVARARPWPSQ